MTQDSRTGAATEATTPSPARTATATATGGATAVRKLSARRRKEVVAVLMFSGGPIFESSIPLSVFGVDRQDAGVPRYRLLVCAGEDGPLRTTGGLELTAPYGLDALGRAGTVVVPAWRSISQPPPAAALAALRRAHEEGARIIGLCTGAFVLAAAGLLDGRPATTHWMYAPTLAKRYPSVHVDPRELFVDDGDILTSAGTAAGIDLCLHVVRTDHGADAANALARRLVVPPRRGAGQERYLDRSLPEEIGGDPLAEVVAWALEHLHEQFDVETLAARAYMSRRTFDRRFRSLTGSAPLQWLITQRVLQAQRLLETSDYSVDEVAGRCGFRSPVALRGHFRRQLGASPASYRSAFRARRPQEAERGERDGRGERAERFDRIERDGRGERMERGDPRGDLLPHPRRADGDGPGRGEPEVYAARQSEHGRAEGPEVAGAPGSSVPARLRGDRGERGARLAARRAAGRGLGPSLAQGAAGLTQAGGRGPTLPAPWDRPLG
ncbi:MULTISPECIES: GlxA family transcriptional regulator [Streptomycetaceae]|uniref:AraC family transcription regulator n=1 Tax=Streptantibioticus cattleyicolor (strain ATCC 35852 / DSM 46488 / JCM 4925 / NBRC 14057 / NRRL 8057) TaxID=1003195 RepID=F8JT78_STREN|nr:MULTISPECIES: helix-turn-helix domain-containing protein [Streptomycetaceae]AEW94228.1 AraC family transcription regulator [Streptantibioticus cattleyicolor NRRL 8057 = DSM 46488]MYS58886.1 helix-turn-helix domain-containing protein [Streptomyces sp. SID5468]CCB74581.1 Transcriptional activator (modular protein) [Streptantibioticus cattleyicolor NRRL 8057 = DSM 46488]